jgi:ABC-type glutathione transport system ATPase component
MLLDVANLSVDLPTSGGARRIVRGASFALDHGQTLGIVGESGSGKTMTALALMGLLPDGATTSGAILFEGRDLLAMSEAELRDLRGDRIAMIFQEPMTALNPLHSIGRHPASRSFASGGAASGRDPAGARRSAGSRKARARLSASAFGWPAAAGDDRDGARLRAAPDHRRRADHRA